MSENSLIQNSARESLTAYKRRITRVVNVGDVPLGGTFPIRVQSMTTTDTMDTEATVAQSIRMIEGGCEYVRITAPSIKEAENLRNIKNELRKRGYPTPLVADIHFTPNAAEVAARIVEKVRVNPGNYADKKKFEHTDYSEETYRDELEKIRQRFVPLVKICKEYGTAMRIGANHGSLSDRIMSRYGDTPLGMVESALEFVRICEENNFYQVVLSMKSSNPQVMVHAYRLLIQKMNSAGMNYPLHLGVTEAGEGEDGRIKSAAGIGTLLEDGIGDTIRVSLTEDPEFEIPVAKILVNRYKDRIQNSEFGIQNKGQAIQQLSELPYAGVEYNKYVTREVHTIGGRNVPVIVADLAYQGITSLTQTVLGALQKNKDQVPDYLFAGDSIISTSLPENTGIIYNAPAWKKAQQPGSYPYFNTIEHYLSGEKSPVINFVALQTDNPGKVDFTELNKDNTLVWVMQTNSGDGMAEQRRICLELKKINMDAPVIIKREYANASAEEVRLYSATDTGALLIDGMGDGLWISAEIPTEVTNSIGFGILQATRTRISKTEYISCPSCGRTLFNLQKVTARIHERTAHLKGVKIGIMGCIVNGPGEMADADYGYVGTGVGKITLYKGKQVVQRNIASEQAVDALIALIKENGDWKETEN